MLGLGQWQLILLLLCMISTKSESKDVLKMFVPLKLGFHEFVTWDGNLSNKSNLSFSGFSVEVFQKCVAKLSYKLDYELKGFGNGVSDPSYNDMVNKLANKEVDGIVADLTITEERMKQVDFTQPYIQSSLMMVVPFHYAGVGQRWSFLKPFGPKLWASIAALFVITGVTIFVLENEHPLFQQQPQVEHWTTRMANFFWFMSLTLVFWQRKDHEISTSLGRLLMVFWLLVVLIFTSTYTASLASILSTQQPSPTLKNFEDLLRSGQPVGCQDGSFTENYIQKSLQIIPSRLRKLVNESEYVTALELGPKKKGGIAAILEESPYIQSFLNSECKYTTSGNEIAYFGGFAFAFQKNSNLTDDFSRAIISLSTNRELHNVKENYLGSGKCIKPNASTIIPIQGFGGLFIVIGVLYGFCILFRILGWILIASNSRKLSSRSLGQVSPVEVPKIAHVGPDHELKMGQVSPYHEVEMGHVRHDEAKMHPVQEGVDAQGISSMQSKD